jgi:hypothetical protein
MKAVFAATLAAAVLSAPLLALAQESVEIKRFEEEKTLSRDLYAPTTPDEPLPGPKVVTSETCRDAPEVCKARKEELRRKRQACHDNPADCRDPALRAAKQ